MVEIHRSNTIMGKTRNTQRLVTSSEVPRLMDPSFKIVIVGNEGELIDPFFSYWKTFGFIAEIPRNSWDFMC